VRVLALSSYGSTGGSELALARFLEYRPPDCEAEVVLVSDGPLRELLDEVGVHATAMHGFEGRPGVPTIVRFSYALGPLLERTRPDVVWAVGQKAALLAAPAVRFRRIPLVWHKVDFSWDRLLAKPLALASTAVVGCSHAVVKPVGGGGRRVRGVVWPPLRFDPAVRARPDPDRPTVGTLARLVPYKGHHLLVRAASILREEFPAVRVVIAGGEVDQYPDYPRELRALISELGLERQVELPGFIRDVAPVLERMTVFVNATYRDEQGFGLEGLGAGLLEASWAGIPVVAPAGGGSDEAVVHGLTGTLVSRPDPGELAQAIARYLRDPKLAEATGAAGMKFAREGGLGPDVAAGRMFDLLRRVADERPQRRIAARS
jgi:glycosyltransferase involved in cell wall biosynthesis